jgi:CheY-like chemotaxis protein
MGIGLEPELLTRAFDLFVQGERGIDRSQGGLGIGLTLVRRLSELHGGTVQAKSGGSGQGATFTVRLPAIDAPGAVESANKDPGKTVRQCVAIVEDNEDARTTLRMLLEIEGHEVQEAADGASGVVLVAGRTAITTAFVDIGLPGMSGFEVARAVRRKRGGSVRLVAMSGYGGDQDVAKGTDAGFDAYLVKPVEIEALRDQLGPSRG